MVEEVHMPVAERCPRKRKSGKKKDNRAKKKMKGFPGGEKKVKINQKMKKLYRKRARAYNSDNDDNDEDELAPKSSQEARDDHFSEGDGEDGMDFDDKEDFSDDEAGEIQPGIANFSEGLRAFKMAFKSIVKNSAADDTLGPVLSAQKKLVAEKLAEEEAERKVKGEARKEKHLVGEKGHVKPANYLDSHEKFLIGVATKGVVKLFNAVNKAQSVQKGLNPSRSKDEKDIKKRRKQAFFSELSRSAAPTADSSSKGKPSSESDGEAPAWAPLQDNYMLTSSKLKDWDKMPESAVADDVGGMSEDDSSDDD